MPALAAGARRRDPVLRVSQMPALAACAGPIPYW
jgi:hypothetical protein